MSNFERIIQIIQKMQLEDAFNIRFLFDLVVEAAQFEGIRDLIIMWDDEEDPKERTRIEVELEALMWDIEKSKNA